MAPPISIFRCLIVALLGISSILSSTGVNGFLNAKQKVAMLAIFNKARATTSLSASNMKMLAWDDALASQMENYTLKCGMSYQVLKSPPAYFFYRDAARDPVGVAQWRTLRMAPYYNFSSADCMNTTQSLKICRHPEIYARGLNAEVERVGCGMTICGPKPKDVYHACAFGKGNFPENPKKPFVTGPRCSQCPTGYPFCDNGLCAKNAPTAIPSISPTRSKAPTTFPTRRRRG